VVDIMKKIILDDIGDHLELKTKTELIEILRSYIKYETLEGTILSCPLYGIYLVYKFFRSLTILKEVVKK
jgi:hypothetical protein